MLWNNRQCIIVTYMLWNATYIQEHFLVKIQIHVIYLNYNKMMRLGGIYSNKI